MPIDITKDDLKSAGELARHVPGKNGKASGVGKINRWILRGVSVNGQTVRLEAVRLGGQWMSTLGALHEFAERQTAPLLAAASPQGQPTERSPGRRKQVEAAERDLERAGI